MPGAFLSGFSTLDFCLAAKKVIPLSLIPCTDPCIYQQDGCCTLSRAASGGDPAQLRDCVHYLPRPASQEHRQSLPDVLHRDEL